MAKSAPIDIRLVTSKFDLFGDTPYEENKKHILASYHGKVTRKFERYDSGVYGNFY